MIAVERTELLAEYRAWNQGYVAGVESVPSLENPHPFGTESHRYWELGRVGWPFPSMRWAA